MENTEFKKIGYMGMRAAYSLLALVPPLGMLFIIVDWTKGAKVDAVSVFGLVLGILLSVVYYLQLTGQM